MLYPKFSLFTLKQAQNMDVMEVWRLEQGEYNLTQV
jgi:hypothetical protein